MGFKVYTSGGMGGRTVEEVTKERREIIRLFHGTGVQVLDPWRTEKDDPGSKIPLQFDYRLMKQYVAKDEYAIRQADLLLTLTGDVPSDGTWWEMGLAHYECKIPVVMISPKRARGELMGFSNVKVDAIFGTAKDAVEFILANYVHNKGDK